MVCRLSYRSSITGVKSMVSKAGRPGMSGMRVVSRSRICEPKTCARTHMHTHAHTHTHKHTHTHTRAQTGVAN